MMQARTLHRWLGALMLLPFCAWAITGLIFFLKPGYADAYELLTLKIYPPNTNALQPFAANPDWQSCKLLRTTLGDHLIAQTREGCTHLDLATRTPKAQPSDEEVRRLLEEAIAASPNPARYGQIVSLSERRATTDTGVRITLNWECLTVMQRGNDTDWIDRLYKIHYLQLTGSASTDRVIGFMGIVLLLALNALGLKLLFVRRAK